MVGQTIAHFQIEARIGAGGMGEVYRARDTRLGRSVAVKMLPEEFARDVDRIARFEREAKLLASLNHAHIAVLHGLEQSDGKHFLIMELVEGDTLADRIQRGPMPAEDALTIAHQMAEALEAAHEKGIIHRDLKPANVKITPEGKVKVLDFGLAKALEAASPMVNSLSPTFSVMATNAGVILGTAGYMSPEQARGHATDQRSDIFSFACVLYEMLTGRRAFQGETVTDAIASVVAREPDWRAMPGNLHPRTEELIRRCLAKNRKDRWHAMADVRVELETIMADPHGLELPSARAATREPLWRRALLPAAMAVFGALTAGGATLAVLNTRPAPPLAVTRFSLALPEGQRILNSPRMNVAISPDGANVVYSTRDQMYLRGMSDMAAQPVRGTSATDSGPFFSPDGRWLGYYSAADRKLKKVALVGGAVVTICEMAGPPAVAVWNPDDYIYIGRTKGIVRVSANGGELENVLTLKDDETAHRPQLLPGGDALLFTLRTGTPTAGRWDDAQIVVQQLTSGERRRLIQGGSDGRYVPTGHIVYALGTTLFAVPFDLGERQVTGDPIAMVEGVRRGTAVAGGGAEAQFAFSNNGSMAFIPSLEITANDVRLELVSRSGAEQALRIPAGQYSNPRISPDGTQLAVQVGGDDNRNVWVSDLKGVQPIHQLTFGGMNDKPLWTLDSRRVVFTSTRDGDDGLFWQRVDGGPAERLARLGDGIRPQAEAWLSEKILVFSDRSAGGGGIAGGGDWMISVGADQKPTLIVPAPAGNASVSPDGRWLAYSSFESGRGAVHVQPFPPTGEKHQITTDGGTSPLWSRDGRQLFYLSAGAARQIMAVDVQTDRGFAFGKTTALPIQGIVTIGPRSYDITPDGKSFVVMVAVSQAEPAGPATPRDQINVTLNWHEELKRLVPIR